MLTVVLFVVVITGNIAANLLLKFGTGDGRAHCTIIGIGCFGLAILAYLALLRRVPLNVAQGILVLQVVGVIIGSWLVLGEPVPPLRWIGIGLVVAGTAIIAWSHA